MTIRAVATVTHDLLVDNDDGHNGRLPLLVDCPACGDQVPRRIGMLGPGRWAIDHQHGGYWSAHLLGLDEERTRPAPPVVPRARYNAMPAMAEARAFVDALAVAR